MFIIQGIYSVNHKAWYFDDDLKLLKYAYLKVEMICLTLIYVFKSGESRVSNCNSVVQNCAKQLEIAWIVRNCAELMGSQLRASKINLRWKPKERCKLLDLRVNKTSEQLQGSIYVKKTLLNSVTSSLKFNPFQITLYICITRKEKERRYLTGLKILCFNQFLKTQLCTL